MSHQIIKTACVMAGFAVAALAATSALAAPPLSVKQKNEMAEAMARNYQSAQESPTTAQGGVAAEVPAELDHYLTASPDAHGHMRVRDTDPTGPTSTPAVEVSDEI